MGGKEERGERRERETDRWRGDTRKRRNKEKHLGPT